MALRARRGGAGNGLDAWPGYVDALSTLLMVIMFVLLVFVLAQAFESVVLHQRNEQLTTANQTLVQERARNETLTGSVSRLNKNLSVSDAARAALMANLRDLNTQTANTMAERDKVAALLREVEMAAAASATVNRMLTGKLDAQTKRANEAAARAAALDMTVKADKATIDAKLSDLARLAGQLASLTALRDELSKQVSAAEAAKMTEQQRRQAVEATLDDEKKLGDTAQARIALLTQQLQQARSQLTASEQQREVSEQKRADEHEKASGLTVQLNLALAAQVEELRKYRSDFFGKLREVLANKPGISIVGDRFVFQSEVLFPQGSADMTAAGTAQMMDLAATFKKITDEIPPDVNWVLRIDGHTDSTPVHTARFASNWELSAARAITVVKFLVTQGIPASHLAATGFAENQPFEPGDSPEANAKNRRIEIRLTDR